MTKITDIAAVIGASPLKQPPLPFADTALEPTISSKTFSFHYGKHHKGYFDTLAKLIDGTPWLDEFRTLFGDDRADYAESMQRHYEQGAAPDWPGRYVTSYATMHPWEDWAESWAHYLHIVDTLESAADHQLALAGEAIALPPLLLAPPPAAAERRAAFDRQLDDWGRMALAMNAVNRSMGMPDPYPFVLGPAVLDKLYFIHRVIAEAARAT